MTKDETRKYLMTVNTMYRNWKVADVNETVRVWHWMLEDVSVEEAEEALKEYAKKDRYGYAPAPSQIKGIIEKNKNKSGIDWDALAKELMGV